MKQRRFLLPLSLQKFAENDPPNPQDPTNTPNGGANEPGSNPTGGAPANGAEPKTFTQEQLDAIIADRLARERKKQEDAEKKRKEDEDKKRLEEEGKYKEVADQLRAQLDAIKAEAKKAKKETLLIQAGYTKEQVGVLIGTLSGETDEELATSVEALKATIPPKPTYADPSAGNGRKVDPKPTDLEDKGKTLYQRLKEKGKIRR